MITDRVRQFFVIAFVLLFFAYLFGPVIIMGITAFNSSAFPRVAPWDCFSVEWFDVLLADGRLMEGLRTSVGIGLGVVVLAVPFGLAGALVLMQVTPRVRPWFYTIAISPILVPGVVLGISTLLFWDRFGRLFGADTGDSIFYNGIFLTIIGQSTFISAFAMLVFVARLQRFDPALQEAALDLGASNTQVFRKIMLPFLRPAIGSAAVLAFLASFENYNTTVFTVISQQTLTTVLASKVRYGIDPSISALAVAIVVITIFGAVLYEIAQRRAERRRKQEFAMAAAAAAGTEDSVAKPRSRRGFLAEPAVIMTLLIFVAGFATVYFAGTVGVEECKATVLEQKRAETERRVRDRELRQLFKEAGPSEDGGQTVPSGTEGDTGGSGGGGVFSPQNLTPGAGDDSQQGTGGGIFSPQNLTPGAGDDSEQGNGGGVFNPENLTPAPSE